MNESGGLECFWSDLSKHPRCPHGPTLLFGRRENGQLKQFYACSACRDRKLCNFYADKDVEPTEARKKAWKEEAKKALTSYNHRRLFIRLNQANAEIPERRAYCHTCEKIVLFRERNEHADHELRVGLSDEEMKNPTEVLKPLANVKKEAQYLFSKKATAQITEMLIKAGAEQVLCIGAPRIHEYITQNFSHKISSLLMDFDGRFHNFFGPLDYCWYNLFNNHFFTDEAAQTFEDFITQNNGKNTFVVCDPPFGGRVESISQTLKTIGDRHERLNAVKDPKNGVKIIFVFPYFMESIIQRKSNPPGTNGGLKDLKMSDYKVDYDNHPLFLTGSSGRKYGSPVRLFTNIDLNIFELPSEDGYKYCGKCEKWTSSENKHCKKCKRCTSKDGRRYKHCDACRRCVKPTWKHCDTCDRCTLDKHVCGEKPKISGRCFKCGKSDHVEIDCEKFGGIVKNDKKRKNETTVTEICEKKTKVGKKLGEKRKISSVETSELENIKKSKKKTSETKVTTKDGNSSFLTKMHPAIGKSDVKSKRTRKLTIVQSTETNGNVEERKNPTNGANFVAENEEAALSSSLTAKEAKKLRRMKKKAPIEWIGVANSEKAKKKSSNETISATSREKNGKSTNGESNGENVTKKIAKKKSSVSASKVRVTRVKSEKLTNFARNATKKRKIDRT